MRRTYLVVYLISCLWQTLSNHPTTVARKFSGLHVLTLSALDSDINALILDYLTTEGYSSAAASLSKEANLRPTQEEESIKARQQIQHSIHSGGIQEAIEALNELEPQVSQCNIFFPQILL
jgi:hypothetical protein